jgi:hypothetical protein
MHQPFWCTATVRMSLAIAAGTFRGNGGFIDYIQMIA